MKHGAYSQKLTPDEDDREFAALERIYVAHYRPLSEFELREVRQLAVMDWRLERYGRMEAEILDINGFEREHERGPEGFEYGGAGWAMNHDCSKARAVQAVAQVEDRLRRQFVALKAKLDLRLEQRARESNSLFPNTIPQIMQASN
jgi:hypothetical protein